MFYKFIFFGAVATLFHHNAHASCVYDWEYGEMVENGGILPFAIMVGYLLFAFKTELGGKFITALGPLIGTLSLFIIPAVLTHVLVPNLYDPC